VGEEDSPSCVVVKYAFGRKGGNVGTRGQTLRRKQEVKEVQIVERAEQVMMGSNGMQVSLVSI
jgi:hypothetical protein